MPFVFSDRRVLAILGLIVAMISIQSGASLAKQIFPVVGPIGTTLLRQCFAAVIMFAIWRPWRYWPKGREWIAIALYGTALGGMNLLFYIALETIPLGIAVALEFTGPLAVALLGSRRLLDLVWVVLAVLGIGLLLPMGEGAQALDPVGIGFALGAGLCWALYIIFGQRAGNTLHGGTAAALGMSFAALLVIPVAVVTVGDALLQWSLLPIGIGVAVFSGALPYSLEMVGLKALPAKNFSILMSLEPAIGALAGLAFLGEHLSLLQWLAIALVIIASVGSTVTARKTCPTPEVVA